MSPKIIAYGALFLAIIFETIATTFLKQSQQFTQPLPTIGCLVGYGVAFYLLSITLKTMPVGIAYAIWSAFGIVLISLIGKFIFKQQLDVAAWLGIGLIITGVLLINIFSKSVAH